MKIKCTKEYYDTGELYLETYYKDDSYCWHREDGPAYICYYKSRQKSYESYWQNDQCHRTNGPAQIWYSENGEITKTEWLIKGKSIKPTNLMKLLWRSK